MRVAGGWVAAICCSSAPAIGRTTSMPLRLLHDTEFGLGKIAIILKERHERRRKRIRSTPHDAPSRVFLPLEGADGFFGLLLATMRRRENAAPRQTRTHNTYFVLVWAGCCEEGRERTGSE